MCTEVPVGSYGNQALNYHRFFCSLTYTVKFQQDKDFVIGYKLSYWWWLLDKWTLWSAVLRGVCWSMIDCRGWSLSRVPGVPAWICHFHLPTFQHAMSCHEVFMGAESAAIPERSSKQGCVTLTDLCVGLGYCIDILLRSGVPLNATESVPTLQSPMDILSHMKKITARNKCKSHHFRCRSIRSK